MEGFSDYACREYAEHAVNFMRGRGQSLGPGMTAEQLEAAELAYGIVFPADLRIFLSVALPLGERFPDWRKHDSEEINQLLRWPSEGILIHVRQGVWEEYWGPSPSNEDDAVGIVESLLAEAPKLVPFCGHRYFPCEPTSAGNPVFSVYQTDTIVYGSDFEEYLLRELEVPRLHPLPRDERRIGFWSDLAEAELFPNWDVGLDNRSEDVDG